MEHLGLNACIPREGTQQGIDPSDRRPAALASLLFRSEPSETADIDNVLSIQEHERQHLAQELHDSAGQLLVALQLGLTHLRLVEKDCQHACIIEEISDVARQIDREIRSLSFLRYPAELAGRCLGSAVESLARGFGSRTGVRTTFKSVGDTSQVDDGVSLAILRVAQEALSNVHRHSRATTVRVALERRKDSLRLTVADDGVGFPAGTNAQKESGLGLSGMRHRIEGIGGHLTTNNLKRGAKLTAVAPVAMAG